VLMISPSLGEVRPLVHHFLPNRGLTTASGVEEHYIWSL
jgi:hypothetical protein